MVRFYAPPLLVTLVAGRSRTAATSVRRLGEDTLWLTAAATARRDWRAANHHNHDTLLAGIVNCPRITILCALSPPSSASPSECALRDLPRPIALTRSRICHRPQVPVPLRV